MLRPGGILAIVDKNAGSLERPTPLAAEPGGQVDRRETRALDVPERRPGPRALVLARRRSVGRLGRQFEDVGVAHLLSPTESALPLFRRVPAARLMTLWSARAPGVENE